MKKNRYIIAFIILSLFCLAALTSCDIYKKASKLKSDTSIENDITTEGKKVIEEVQEGGKIETDIIPINLRPKDDNGLFKEFMKTYLDGGLRKTVHYKADGSVTTKCENEEIYRKIIEDYIIKDNSTEDQTFKAKDSEKEQEFDDKIIINFMIGLALIVAVALSIMFLHLRKTIAIATKLATRL